MTYEEAQILREKYATVIFNNVASPLMKDVENNGSISTVDFLIILNEIMSDMILSIHGTLSRLDNQVPVETILLALSSTVREKQKILSLRKSMEEQE